MSNLISRFEEDLQLAGFANRSSQSYVASVRRLQRFVQKPLEDITEEDLRQYWLTCKSEFGWSAATLRISYSGIKHFFTRTLVQPWSILNEVHFKRDETLPTVLSCREVKHIIDHLPTVQSRTFYITLYSLGLRLLEALTLQVGDILSERGFVHVHNGKGSMDRMVPLPSVTLNHLRRYYVTHRNPKWLFPALGRSNGKHARSANTHASTSAVQDVLQRTIKKLGIKKHIHPHVFRHSYATHAPSLKLRRTSLIEANVPIRHVQKLLGHKTLNSTMIYLHVTTHAQTDSHRRVAQLMQGVLS